MVVVELNNVLDGPNSPPPTAPYRIKYNFNIIIKDKINNLTVEIILIIFNIANTINRQKK